MKQTLHFKTRQEAEAFALLNGIVKKQGVFSKQDNKLQYHTLVPATGELEHTFHGGPSYVHYDDAKLPNIVPKSALMSALENATPDQMERLMAILENRPVDETKLAPADNTQQVPASALVTGPGEPGKATSPSAAPALPADFMAQIQAMVTAAVQAAVTKPAE